MELRCAVAVMWQAAAFKVNAGGIWIPGAGFWYASAMLSQQWDPDKPVSCTQLGHQLQMLT